MPSFRFSRSTIIMIGLPVVLVTLGFTLPLNYVDILTVFFINAIVVVGFRFITTMGEWNFAHVGMMGLGAYTSAILTKSYGWPFWASLPVGGLAAAGVALMFSYPLLRMRGFYFFMGSFALGELMRLIWLRVKTPFGGYNGIIDIPAPSLPGLPAVDFHNITVYYLLCLSVALLSLIFLYRLEKSEIGTTIKAVAAQDSVAQSVGINLFRYKTLAFAVGAFFAGLAGVLLAHRLGSIDPSQFQFTYGLYVVVWVVVGGRGNFVGPLIGLGILTLVNETIRRIAGVEVYTPMIYGSILIVAVLFMRQGLVGLPRQISTLIQKLRMKRRSEIA